MRYAVAAWFAILVLAGCGVQENKLDSGWTAPAKVTATGNGLERVPLYNWHGTMLAWQALGSDSAKSFQWNPADNSWSEGRQVSGLPGDALDYPAIDQRSDNVFFNAGYFKSDQLVVNFLTGRLTENGALAGVSQQKWVADKQVIFGTTEANVHLGETATPYAVPLDSAVVNGAQIYVPYALSASSSTHSGKRTAGPFANGVFHSADSGVTWQVEPISAFQAHGLALSGTSGYYHYFSIGMVNNQGYALWYSRKPAADGGWSHPQKIIKSFTNGRFVAIGQDDTVHLCWLDRRHEKKTLNLVYPNRGNYEVAYCQRKDSEGAWNRDVILSRGVVFSYDPSMSVEGDRIVVAWTGGQNAHAWPFHYYPYDIYYVTSKDGGKTWARPLRLTDCAKDGVTSGMASVALLNGTIHILYAQGTVDPSLQISRQGPWPIHHQQRPFPL